MIAVSFQSVGKLTVGKGRRVASPGFEPVASRVAKHGYDAIVPQRAITIIVMVVTPHHHSNGHYIILPSPSGSCILRLRKCGFYSTKRI